jgi:hypothetical protein
MAARSLAALFLLPVLLAGCATPRQVRLRDAAPSFRSYEKSALDPTASRPEEYPTFDKPDYDRFFEEWKKCTVAARFVLRVGDVAARPGPDQATALQAKESAKREVPSLIVRLEKLAESYKQLSPRIDADFGGPGDALKRAEVRKSMAEAAADVGKVLDELRKAR